MKKFLTYPMRVALVYLFFGVLWILLTDWLVFRLASDPQQAALISMYKGWGFVVASTLLLYFSLFKELSHRKWTRESLRAISNRHEAILAAIPDILVEVDQNKVYSWANSAGLDFFGPDVVGREAAFYFVGEQEIYQAVKPIFNGDENTVYVESWQRRQDGQKRLLAWWCRTLKDMDGNVVGALSSAHDITERKQAEEALRESEDKFKYLFDNSVLGKSITLVTGEINVNRAFCEMLGYSSEELQNRKWQEISHPDDLELTQTEINTLLSGQRESTCFIKRYLHKNGSIIWAEVGTALRRDAEGKPLYFLTHINDITVRKQAEQAFQASNAYLQTVLDSVTDAVLVTDAETGQIIDVNQGMCAMYGYSYAEAMRTPIGDLNQGEPPHSQAEALEWQHKARESGPQTFEWLAKHKDGHLFRVEISTRFAVIGGNNRFVVVVRDITERKRTEELTRQQSEQLRLLYEASQRLNRTLDRNEIYQAICDFMSANAPNDGFVISAFDPETQLITCRAYWMDNKWMDVSAFPPIPLEKEGRGTQSIAIRTGQSMLSNDYQAQVKTAETSYYINDETNEVETEVPPEEEDVTRSALIVPLKMGNRVSGVIQVMSYRLNAYTENQLKLLDALALHIASAEQNALLYAQVQTELNERKLAEEEIRQLNATLKQRVEERTRALEDAQERLVRQEKLAVLGQLAGGVGHELRNPLAVINNAVYYLKLVQPDAEEKVKSYHSMIEKETHTAEKIITDLLDFARIKSVDREPVAVSELVRRVLERFPAPETVAVKLKIPASLPPVFADPRQMEQVLGNLVVNACQAMKDGGKLTISAAKKGGNIAIAVKDTGVGIPPENMEKLFEPLFTTKTKGIGLGLAVSRKLAEANGGRIEVQSEPGAGSTFTLLIPIHEG
jgi:PAS domain S-box-containing protein